MCMIIHRPHGAPGKVTGETLARITQTNNDGFGLAWSYNGRLMTARYPATKRSKFHKHFMTLQKADVPLLAHARWTTHGGNAKHNLHPFLFRGGSMALVHNGILDIPCRNGWSDTRTFVYDYLDNLPEGWESHPAHLWAIEELTTGSRIAIMRRNGDVMLIHEKSGIWEDGIWYSNGGFRKFVGAIKSSDGADGVWVTKDGKTWVKESKPDAADVAHAAMLREARSKGQVLAPFDGVDSPSPKVRKMWYYQKMILCEDCLRLEQSGYTDPPLSLVGAAKCDICYSDNVHD